MEKIFFEITIILCLVSILSIIFKLLKQPLILAYILTGIIIGPFGQIQLVSRDVIALMSEFGITLLLFMLGLEMKLKEFKVIGKTAFVMGSAQIIFTFFIVYAFSLFLSFSSLTSFYIAAALTFSSTIVIVKLLSDNKDLNSFYGKILISLLIIQDFAAIFILIFLSGLGSNSAGLNLKEIGFVLIKGGFLFVAIIFLSNKIFPKFIHTIAKSEEILFLFSLAWVFGLATLVSSPFIGFSIEIGGFLAGIALASANENFQIIARIKALRDFFVTMFFIFLGMSMVFTDIFSLLPYIFLFSFFVIFVKPLILMVVMGTIGFRRRVSFLTSLNIGQISEFSFVIIFLGNKIGHIPNDVVSLITGVGITSFIISSYLIQNAKTVHKNIDKYLSIFERKNLIFEDLDKKELTDLKNHVVLVGAHRMGESILNALEDVGYSVVVVDFDPEIVEKLKKKGIPSIFGDVADSDILERVKLDRAKLVISTVPDREDNLFLIKSLNHENRLAKIIVMAQNQDDAKSLYKAGADYVVLPELSGGRHIAKILKEEKLDLIESFKKKDLSYFSL